MVECEVRYEDFCQTRRYGLLVFGFDCGRKTLVHGDLPVFVCRLHLEVIGTRFLADVRDVATRALAVHHHLDQTTADRASQYELEPAFPRLRLVARLPCKSEVSARGRERVGFQIPAAGPGSGVVPDYGLFSSLGWWLRTRGKEKRDSHE